jgi:hypothetical protein
MRRQCPDGCGRQLPRRRNGAANRFELIDETVLFFDQSATAQRVSARLDPSDVSEFDHFVANGHRIRSWFLDHLHGEARPGTTPDLLALKRMLDAHMAAALELSELALHPQLHTPQSSRQTSRGFAEPASLVALADGHIDELVNKFDRGICSATTADLLDRGRIVTQDLSDPLCKGLASFSMIGIDTQYGVKNEAEHSELFMALSHGYRAGRGALNAPHYRPESEADDVFSWLFARVSSEELVEAVLDALAEEGAADLALLPRHLARESEWGRRVGTDRGLPVFMRLLARGVTLAIYESALVMAQNTRPIAAGDHRSASEATGPDTHERQSAPEYSRAPQRDSDCADSEIPRGANSCDLESASTESQTEHVVSWVTGTAVSSVISGVVEKLTDDGTWVTREKDSAIWYSYVLPLQLDAEPPRQWLDREMLPLRVRTELLHDVSCSDQDALLAVASLNLHCSRSAVLWESESRSISAACSVYLTDRTRDAAQGSIASAGVLQGFEAHARSSRLADLVQGVPSGADHPIHGDRPTPDPVFAMIERELVPIGEQPSRFIGAEIRRLGDADGVPWLAASGDDASFRGTLAFTASGSVSSAGAATSTIFVEAGAAHPTYGNGALAVLQLPLDLVPGEVPMLANGLNAAEAREFTGFDFLGAWVPDPSDPSRLSFATFWPSGFAISGALEVTMQNLAMRNLWAAARLVQ